MNRRGFLKALMYGAVGAATPSILKLFGQEPTSTDDEWITFTIPYNDVPRCETYSICHGAGEDFEHHFMVRDGEKKTFYLNGEPCAPEESFWSHLA